MAYLFEFHETTVAPYLFNLELSREGRVIVARLLYETRVYADSYRNNPERRLSPGSDCFRVDLVFRDPAFGIFHQLRLIISDAAAEYGVLRVVFMEDEKGPPGH